ncbi:MAG: right-handed parallel beta-helix repeat-containing protein [Acidimicrobiales bacterium]
MLRKGRSGTLAGLVVVAGTATGTLTGAVLPGGAAVAGAATAPSCTANVGGSGLSAAVVATPHQSIAHKTVNATGCDIGIYVGAGASHVTISSVTVSGASFEGILAQKTSHLTIKSSTVTGNGFKTANKSAPPLQSGLRSFVSDSFGISLFGVSNSTVEGNKVLDNGRGGIGLMDNGPRDPGTITQDHKASLVASSHDRITGNQMSRDYGGCALVVAAQNLGGTLSHLVISGNTVTGTGLARANGPDIGGIVVAADLPSSTVSDVDVSANKVTGSWEGGVVVNAEAFNSSTKDVHVTGNTVARNNLGHQEAPNTAGIIVFANDQAKVPPKSHTPENVGTVVSHNTVTAQFYGIWSVGRSKPTVSHNAIKVTTGGTPISIG